MKQKPYNYSIEVINGNIDFAIKKLGKRMNDLGIMREIRDRQYFKTPSLIKHEKEMRRHHLLKKEKE